MTDTADRIKELLEADGRRILADASGGPVSRRIGICEECEWWFEIEVTWADDKPSCPKPGCYAEVMVVKQAPEFPRGKLTDRYVSSCDAGIFQYNVKTLPHAGIAADQMRQYIDFGRWDRFDAKA